MIARLTLASLGIFLSIAKNILLVDRQKYTYSKATRRGGFRKAMKKCLSGDLPGGLR
jgi:hypothetical protein